jgi:hypothetical protein
VPGRGSFADADACLLERNPHDGAQQHLVAIKVKLGLVEILATKDPETAKATIVALKRDASSWVRSELCALTISGRQRPGGRRSPGGGQPARGSHLVRTAANL